MTEVALESAERDVEPAFEPTTTSIAPRGQSHERVARPLPSVRQLRLGSEPGSELPKTHLLEGRRVGPTGHDHTLAGRLASAELAVDPVESLGDELQGDAERQIACLEASDPFGVSRGRFGQSEEILLELDGLLGGLQ